MPDYPLLVLEGLGTIATILLAWTIYQFRADRAKARQIAAMEQQLAAAQQTLQERTLQRDQYQSIFNNAVEGIFQTTPDGHYINANLSLARIYGYSSTEELIVNLADIERQLYVIPKRRTDFIWLMQQYNAVSGFESQVYRKGGDIIWISENARSVRNEAGKILYFEGTVQEITERKRAEEDLRKSETKNRALLNLIPDTLFRLNCQGMYLDYKTATVNDSGISASETVGRNLRDLLPTEVAGQFKTAIEQALATHELQVFECQVQWSPDRKCFLSGQLDDEDGLSRVYEVRIVVCGKDEVLAIVRNMTERKKIERMKSEFVSIVSHELRTPLTSVRGSLGLIIGGVVGEIPPQAKSLLDIAYKNSERLVLIINDILDIEKIESGKMDFHLQPQKLMPLVEQAIDAMRSYGDQFGIQVALQQDIPNLCVSVDGTRLIQVLTNLLSNAVKFSPPTGTVTVTVSRILAEEVASCTLPWVRVSVSDRGPGISPDFQSRIFQKFAQADSSSTRQKGGTGLGLNISQAIIERLNGTIGFTTAPAEGTTFYFDLPEWREIKHPSNPVSQVSRSRVLICEDDQDIATLLSLMLQQEGFATDIAHSAAAAKQLLHLSTPTQPCPYTAMTVDLGLPDQSGISLIRELRDHTHTRHLPIVVVSANADQGREELKGSGFAIIDWLDKPIDQERLFLAVRQTRWQRDGKPRILHVENDSDVLQVVAAILQEIAEVTPAMTLWEAKQQLEHTSFDLLLLDLDLPDGSGLELLSCLDPQTGASLPTVIFSAQELQAAAIDSIAATLVKSRTSNQNLIDTIKSLIQQNQHNQLG